MTIIIDDAGVGDLLFGVVIGAYRPETREYSYGVIDVKYFKSNRFRRKEFLKQASKTVFALLDKLRLKSDESILICRGSIFEKAVENLKKKYGDNRIHPEKVVGEAQTLTETAYLDEIRNLGYEPLAEREKRRARSFFHMMRWLERNPKNLVYAKTGWPRLTRYSLFTSISRTQTKTDKF